MTDLPVIRVAMFDSFGPAHEEVVASFAGALCKLPDFNLHITIFRNDFTPGFKAGLQPYYTGFYRSEESFFSAPSPDALDGPAITTWIGNVDVLFLATSNKDVEKVMGPGVLEWYPDFSRARIVLVSHCADNFAFSDHPSSSGGSWGRSLTAQEALARAWESRRLKYLVLSNAVQSATAEALTQNPYLSLNRPPQAQVFVPLLTMRLYLVPNSNLRAPSVDKRFACDDVVVQGRFSDARDYQRLFRDLEEQVVHDPSSWGYVVSSEGSNVVFEEDANSSLDPRFKLHLLGSVSSDDPDFIERIPPSLKHIIVVHRDLEYTQFYEKLHQMDLLIPLWKENSQYTTIRASSSISAAVSVQVPILLSEAESAAYDFLRDIAVVKREEGESEVDAIARLRKGGLQDRALGQDWLEYLQSIEAKNESLLRDILGAVGRSTPA